MANRLMEKEDYIKAYYHLQDCKDYKDSEKLLEDFILICEKRTWYDRSGNVKRTIENTYDDAARQVSFIKYDATGIRMDMQFAKIGKTEIDTAKLEKRLKEATDINSNLPLLLDAGLDFLSIS